MTCTTKRCNQNVLFALDLLVGRGAHLVIQRIGRGAHEVVDDGVGAGRMTEQRDVRAVAAESSDVVTHPAHGHHLVLEWRRVSE